jgi:hypothetical protein
MYKRNAEPVTLAFVIRVMRGASYAAFFTIEHLYATGRPEVPRFVSPSRITAAYWYLVPGNHDSITKSLDAPTGSWAIRCQVVEKRATLYVDATCRIGIRR